MKKTKFDLYTSASAAAIAAGELKTKFEIETAAHKAFAGNDPLDWEYWSDTFYRLRVMFNTLRAEPSPSQVAAAAAEVAAAPAPAEAKTETNPEPVQ